MRNTDSQWVTKPADAANIKLMRENGATGAFLIGKRRHGCAVRPGVHRVSSSAIPADPALVDDWSQIRLKVREAEHILASSQAGGLFDKNLAKLRAEGRYDIKVGGLRALAVVHLAA
ncbi:hypothetical protein [Blastococcus sp. Marseille-P5729]|uniref:hypothetical protein n=1 Tax=Blastococcus sp. Marseille-P5729 TaxID=2086582 RepID=UPI000D0E6E25|nr:hypothetical protein [Blastococcus sp. Marseille-P5729]